MLSCEPRRRDLQCTGKPVIYISLHLLISPFMWTWFHAGYFLNTIISWSVVLIGAWWRCEIWWMGVDIKMMILCWIFSKDSFFLLLDTKRRQSSVDMIEDKRFFTCHLSAVLSLQRGRCQADVFLLLAYQKRFTTREDDNAVTCSDLQQEWRTAWGSDRDSCTEGASIGCHKRWVTVGRLKEKKLPVT